VLCLQEKLTGNSDCHPPTVSTIPSESRSRDNSSISAKRQKRRASTLTLNAQRALTLEEYLPFAPVAKAAIGKRNE